tara:strand:+ start:580 stop:1206 length:627 start_codon:yes stop_codon:yes gene_type:complete
MKRVENNVLGMYNRIGKLEKFNDNFYPKMNELLKNSEAANNPQNQYMNQNIEAFENIETLQESSNTEQDTINEVDNIMKNVINLNENVLEQQHQEGVVEVAEVFEVDEESPTVEQVEVDEESPKVEEVEGLVEEVDEDDNEDDNVVDGVMDLVNSIESKDNRDLLELDESELLEKTNTELKDYLKNKGLANTGNKKKLVETILNLKKK